MIVIPHWIDRPRGQELPAGKRAERRLRYYLQAAIWITHCAPSLRALAKEIEREPSSIPIAISRGHFSREMAKQIETFIGQDVVRAEHLMFPLEIPSA